MGKYRTMIVSYIPNYLMPIVDKLGEMGDIGWVHGISLRREKVLRLAVLELIEKAAKEIPEILELLQECKGKTAKYAIGNRARKLAAAETQERSRMLGRRIVNDIPPPLAKKRRRRILDATEAYLLEKAQKESEAGELDRKYYVRKTERELLDKIGKGIL